MWVRVLLLALGTFAIGTEAFVIAGLLPEMARDLRVSEVTTGLLVTVFALVYAFGSPVLATFTSAIARKQLLLLSLLLFTVSNLLAAISLNFGLVMAARVLAACGASLYTPTASAVAALLAPAEKRGRALAIVTTGLSTAMVLGVPLGIIIGSLTNWRVTFLFVALLSGIALAGVFLFLPAVASPPAVTLRQRLALLRDTKTVIVLSITFLWIMGAYTVYTYLGPLLTNLTHVQGVEVSGMFFLFGGASVLGGLAGGYGTDRWGSIRTTMIGLIGASVALFAFSFIAVTVVGAALALLVWGLASWMILPVQQHRLVSLTPGSASIVLALNASTLYLGQASGSALGGLLLQNIGLPALGWTGGALQLLALAVVFVSVWLFRRRQQSSTQEQVVADMVRASSTGEL